MNTRDPKSENVNRVRKKQIGLKHFLILSYAASLFIVLAYYAAPYAMEGAQMAIIGICLFSMAAGFLGMVVSIAISLSIAAFSQRSEEKKRRDQIIVMKMLVSFVAMTIGPSLLALCTIIAIGSFFSGF